MLHNPHPSSSVLKSKNLIADLTPHVNFYWVNGERTIPRGHRSGRVEPQRFQIDDRPHSQIRIRQQLPEVRSFQKVFLPLIIVTAHRLQSKIVQVTCTVMRCEICDSSNVFLQFVPLEAEVAAEVPVIQLAPDCLPLFRRQYDNNVSTGLYAFS